MSEEIKKEKQWYIDSFKIFEQKLNGGSKLFTHDLRKKAVKKFSGMNFPTLKDEEWKYTNINPITKNYFIPAVNAPVPRIENKMLDEKFFCGFNCHRIVFVNGIYNEELSDIKKIPEGVIIGSLKKHAAGKNKIIEKYFGKISGIDNAFNALNGAFSTDGLFVYLPKGKVVEHPVQVLYLNGGRSGDILSTPRNLIVASEASNISLIMNYSGISADKYFSNIITETVIEENASVNIYKIQDENSNSFHIEKFEALQSASSLLNHFSISIGGAIVRNDINSKLNGENCECHYYGLSLGSGKQHVDNHTFVDHAKPNCMSNELYKSILDGESRGVFNGKIMVRRDAQKTNAYQSNKTVLLSDKAKIDTKPQLEIFADDVKCSHGATIGHLDDTAYYYIRSRGVPADLAKSMLIRAFANDVIESIKIAELKEKLNQLIFTHLQRVEISNQ